MMKVCMNVMMKVYMKHIIFGLSIYSRPLMTFKIRFKVIEFLMGSYVLNCACLYETRIASHYGLLIYLLIFDLN